MRRLLLLVPLLAALLSVAVTTPLRAAVPKPVPAHLADKFTTPIEDSTYDSATHCVKRVPKGTLQMVAWLQRHSRGSFWGALRCEKWGPHTASLHAEGRAIDWHLDNRSAQDRAAAKRLFTLFTAADSAGDQQALARRMGVEELIWNCGYWSAGSRSYGPYRYCYDRKTGKRKKKLNRTEAHMDHIHIGLTKAAAAGKTSFWRSTLSRR
jgi:hypothetical protein